MTTTADPAEIIGARLRTYREGQNLTQGALAARVHVTQPAISQWERGITMPSRPLQFAVADALRVDRSWLFAEIVGRAS